MRRPNEQGACQDIGPGSLRDGNRPSTSFVGCDTSRADRAGRIRIGVAGRMLAFPREAVRRRLRRLRVARVTRIVRANPCGLARREPARSASPAPRLVRFEDGVLVDDRGISVGHHDVG